MICDNQSDNSDSDAEIDDLPDNKPQLNVIITCKSIKSMYLEYLQDESLLLKPEYQRELCWSSEKMNLFIDTIFKSWIIPNYVIYILSNSEQKENVHSYECIDGQHRLTTLKYYIENTIIPGTNKYIYWSKNGERIYYSMDETNLKILEKKQRRGIKYRNLTKDEKNSFDNFQMSFHMIKSHTRLTIGTKCDIFNRLQNGEKVSSYQKLKNLHQNDITNAIRSNNLCNSLKNINLENKILFEGKVKPKEIEAYYMYFLIRAFLIIDKKTLDINFLDLNIKKYLEANNGSGAPNVKLNDNINNLLSKVNEVINWIATNSEIKIKILSEVLYLYICIYANYGLNGLDTIIKYFNCPTHSNQFSKLNNIKTYKSSVDKVTSSIKMTTIYTSVLKLVLKKDLKIDEKIRNQIEYLNKTNE